VDRHLLPQPREQQVDYLQDLVLRELVEDDDFVDSVEQLGPEDLLELAHDPVLHHVVREPALIADGEAERLVLRDRRRADVRGHDHDRVTKVDAAPLGVGQLPVLEDLQQDVKDVRMRLLDLVQQDDRVRLLAGSPREGAAPQPVLFVLPRTAA